MSKFNDIEIKELDDVFNKVSQINNDIDDLLKKYELENIYEAYEEHEKQQTRLEERFNNKSHEEQVDEYLKMCEEYEKYLNENGITYSNVSLKKEDKKYK